MKEHNVSKWQPRAYPALVAARKMVARFGYSNVSQRIGIPCKIVVVTETVSEKARRIFSECDSILCRY